MTSFKRRLAELFKQSPELLALKQLFQKNQTNAWLVGGCLRDLVLSRPVVDLDISVDKDPTSLAQAWAEENNGRWFWLDKERLQSRVLLANQMTVDFVPLRAATIGGDQILRDFTVNSLALPLSDNQSQQELLDPLDGLADIDKRSLRFCSSRSIADDPLRMLKGIRHAVTLQMELSQQALQQIKAESVDIHNIAAERIRDELGQILLADAPELGFELMLGTGLLQVLFGPADRSWSSADSFSELQLLQRRMSEWAADESSESTINEPYSSQSLFLLATFFRSYQPINLPDILHSKLRLSRQQQRIVLSLQQEPDSQWLAQTLKVASVRQKALLVEALGYFPTEQLIYWSIYRQLIPREMVYDLLGAYQSQQQLGRVSDLLDGNMLSDILHGSGKEIGFWQQRIKLAELDGVIDDSASAINWLKSQLSN